MEKSSPLYAVLSLPGFPGQIFTFAKFSWLCWLLMGGGGAFVNGLTFDVSGTGAETSRLWGLTGERREADGQLPD